jgi:hypothetical protein
MEKIEEYYKLLGITSGATLDDIKSSFLEAEQRLQQDLQSEEPEKRTQAQEKLHGIYEAHQKVMKYYMEHGPPKFQDIAKEREPIHRIPVKEITPEPGCEPTSDTPGIVDQAELKNAPPISSAGENHLPNKTLNFSIIISLTTLVAISIGLLIGIVLFKKSEREMAPLQPLRQATVTPERAFKPTSSANKNVELQVPATRADEKRVPVAKRHAKKAAKVRKKATSGEVTQISRESLENIMKAANQGNAEAQYRLGVLYAKGMGVKKDRREAYKWYRKAASQGHARAQEAMELVHE